MQNIINSREDLDQVSNTPAYAAFLDMLTSSMWRLEKTDTGWQTVEDDSTIHRFGFTRADFPDTTPPTAPVEDTALPAPSPSYKTFTSLEFLDLFTEAEQLSVAEAALQSAQVKLWYDRLLAASYITLSDSRVEAGLSSLVEAGLLTSDRRIEIAKAMQ